MQQKTADAAALEVLQYIDFGFCFLIHHVFIIHQVHEHLTVFRIDFDNTIKKNSDSLFVYSYKISDSSL